MHRLPAGGSSEERAVTGCRVYVETVQELIYKGEEVSRMSGLRVPKLQGRLSGAADARARSEETDEIKSS